MRSEVEAEKDLKRDAITIMLAPEGLSEGARKGVLWYGQKDKEGRAVGQGGKTVHD
jgi:hypothetical protein